MEAPEEILKQALQALEDADTPTDLQEVAFTKVFDLIAARENAASNTDQSLGGHAGKGSPPGDDQSGWDAKIASSFGISAEEVREVFDESEYGLEIILPTSALGDSVKDGLKEIALLISAGRQALGLEDATSTTVIRPIADHYEKKDSHFAKHIDELEDLFVIKPVTRYDKTLKARAKAYEAAGHVAKKNIERLSP